MSSSPLTRLREWARAHPLATAGLRWAIGLGLLASTLLWLDLQEIVDQVGQADPRWLGLALLLSVAQLATMAWRWSFTATRMGLELPFGVACREYYVAVLLNFVLPGGVLGDVARVARQTDGEARPLGLVARSVVIERIVGQAVLWAVLLVAALVWGLHDHLAAILGTMGVVALAVIGVVLFARRPGFAQTRAGQALSRVREELRVAVFSGIAPLVQGLSSLAGLGLLVAMFYCGAVAIGSSMTVGQALLIVPFILAATMLPLTVGGWGVRELSAMALFQLADIPVAQGAASAAIFGVVSLLGALPGAVPLLLQRRRPDHAPTPSP
ncbi:MAG: lysylphosphatidylglycerol synthase transmembrane domain-containing protein [Myxococcota bacterium]